MTVQKSPFYFISTYQKLVKTFRLESSFAMCQVLLEKCIKNPNFSPKIL